MNYQVKDAIVVHSIEELLEELKKYDEDIISSAEFNCCLTAWPQTKIDHAYGRMPISGSGQCLSGHYRRQ